MVVATLWCLLAIRFGRRASERREHRQVSTWKKSFLVRRYNNESVIVKKANLKEKREKEGEVGEKKISNGTRTKDKERNMGIGNKVDEFCATTERLIIRRDIMLFLSTLLQWTASI